MTDNMVAGHTPAAMARRAAIVYVIGLLKGGTGKTTSAIFLALHYARQGLKVIVLDGDQTSQSAYDWSKLAAKAGEPLPFEVERYPYVEDIGERIAELREEYDVVIVDAGGGSRDYFENAVAACDVLLMTLAPSKAETRRLPATLQSATRGAERSTLEDGVDVKVVLVKADARTTQPKDWHDQLIKDGFPVTEAYIPLRVYYTRAYGTCPDEFGDYSALVAEVETESAA